MSAAPRIIEGTWDEVLTHAHELTGHRLRVTVMDEMANPYDHPAFDTSPVAISRLDRAISGTFEESPNTRPAR